MTTTLNGIQVESIEWTYRCWLCRRVISQDDFALAIGLPIALAPQPKEALDANNTVPVHLAEWAEASKAMGLAFQELVSRGASCH